MIQYWLQRLTGRMERIEDEIIEKHPDKLESMQRNGYVRVMSENNHSAYAKPKQSVKKAVKKAVKKVTKKKK